MAMSTDYTVREFVWQEWRTVVGRQIRYMRQISRHENELMKIHYGKLGYGMKLFQIGMNSFQIGMNLFQVGMNSFQTFDYKLE